MATLHHASFDDNPQYDALSYTWGSSIDPIAIRANKIWTDLTASIRPNTISINRRDVDVKKDPS